MIWTISGKIRKIVQEVFTHFVIESIEPMNKETISRIDRLVNRIDKLYEIVASKKCCKCKDCNKK